MRGFLVKFIDKDEKSEDYCCYEVTFSFDAWTYKFKVLGRKRTIFPFED